MIAAGAWSGKIISDALASSPATATEWEGALRPRKGHLLDVPMPAGMPPLRHGLMEIGYSAVQFFWSCLSTLCNGAFTPAR